MAVPKLKSELYNNPLLSDVKIIQICNGEKKEYYGHKTILSNHSKWFLTAFTGNYKEATAAEIEMHDDDPDHFEIMMKFFYNHDWQSGLRGDYLNLKACLTVIGVHRLADKYLSDSLKISVSKMFPLPPHQSFRFLDDKDFEQIVDAYYSYCSDKSTLGRGIATYFLRKHYNRLGQNTGLLEKYLQFSIDVITMIGRQNLEGWTKDKLPTSM